MVRLTLLPLWVPEDMHDTIVYCSERLTFERDCRIFNQLTDFDEGNKPTIQTNPIPPQMQVGIYEEEGLMLTREDHSGKELKFAYAKQLKCLKMSDDASPRNKAIKAFVDALPDDIPLILLWC